MGAAFRTIFCDMVQLCVYETPFTGDDILCTPTGTEQLNTEQERPLTKPE